MTFGFYLVDLIEVCEREINILYFHSWIYTKVRRLKVHSPFNEDIDLSFLDLGRGHRLDLCAEDG